MNTTINDTTQAINGLLERLRDASTAEIPHIRAKYEAYLATLSPNEQLPLVKQINSVLRELADQSVNRLDEVVAAYLSRSQKQPLA